MFVEYEYHISTNYTQLKKNLDLQNYPIWIGEQIKVFKQNGPFFKYAAVDDDNNLFFFLKLNEL